MEFKTDENLHFEVAALLRQHGHDALTVYEQGLRGDSDTQIACICQRERRALVTLDLDFSDIRSYPPGDYNGIVLFRLNNQSRSAVRNILTRIIPLFDTEPLTGRLWVVDEHQIRIRGSGHSTTP